MSDIAAFRSLYAQLVVMKTGDATDELLRINNGQPGLHAKVLSSVWVEPGGRVRDRCVCEAQP